MAETKPQRSAAKSSLSARLLVLTVFFVMLAEFLIYTPSISRYRKVYLEEHVATAHLATLALEASADGMISDDLEKDLLRHADSHGVILTQANRRMLMLSGKMPPKVDATFDLRRGTFVMWIGDAFTALAQKKNRVLRVIGTSPKDPTVTVEVLLDETPMREAMYAYSARILELSIVISLFTAGLVYLSLQLLMVRPMRRITDSMTAFRENPEDAERTITPSGREDEIGVAQRELADMQRDLRAALQQKSRLATLGAAVAKINHDLRNSLATAVLVSDRLADIDDPEVKQVTPRLYDAIDRAVTLCSQTLNYVSDGTPAVKPSHFHLHELVAEVSAAMRTPEAQPNGFAVDNTVDMELDLEGDRQQLFRVLSNLAQNARQAGAGKVRISAEKEDGTVVIEVADDGPGLAPKARSRLFQPFAGSARQGGTGLGLVIVRDILRAHGGDITLAETGDSGTRFRLDLPLRPRGERRRRPRRDRA
jgi:signal transduction histidine kinase